MAKASADIRSLARSHTEAALRTLVGVMNQAKAPAAARVAAANSIIDRGWGKPVQSLSGPEDDEGNPTAILIKIIDPKR